MYHDRGNDAWRQALARVLHLCGVEAVLNTPHALLEESVQLGDGVLVSEGIIERDVLEEPLDMLLEKLFDFSVIEAGVDEESADVGLNHVSKVFWRVLSMQPEIARELCLGLALSKRFFLAVLLCFFKFEDVVNNAVRDYRLLMLQVFVEAKLYAEEIGRASCRERVF